MSNNANKPEQALQNRAVMLAHLINRSSKRVLPVNPVINYMDRDPDGGTRGQGWYYKTKKGFWVWLGSNAEEAKIMAERGRRHRGIIGKVPDGMNKTTGRIAAEFAGKYVAPQLVATTTGMARHQGKNGTALIVEGAAVIGGIIASRSEDPEVAKAGMAVLHSGMTSFNQAKIAPKIADAVFGPSVAQKEADSRVRAAEDSERSVRQQLRQREEEIERLQAQLAEQEDKAPEQRNDVVAEETQQEASDKVVEISQPVPEAAFAGM